MRPSLGSMFLLLSIHHIQCIDKNHTTHTVINTKLLILFHLTTGIIKKPMTQKITLVESLNGTTRRYILTSNVRK